MEILTDADDFARCFADEVYAEMSRRRYSNKDLAAVLGVTPHTAGNRINSRVPFSAVEMGIIGPWLGVDLEVLVRRARTAAERLQAGRAA